MSSNADSLAPLANAAAQLVAEPAADSLDAFLPETGVDPNQSRDEHATQPEAVREIARTIDDRIAALNLLVPSEGGRHSFNFDTGHQRPAKAGRPTDLLSSLEARLASLTEKDRLLERTQGLVSALEQRAGQAAAELEAQVTFSEAHSQVVQHAVAQLQQRAAATIADLEQRFATFDTRRHTIDDALGEAMRVVRILSDLETRIVHLTGNDLERADRLITGLERRTSETTAAIDRRVEELAGERTGFEQSVSELGQRAAATATDLERRIDEFMSQASNIDAARAEAARITGLLSDVETRITHVTGDEGDLARADGRISELERRATDAVGSLDGQVAAAEKRREHLEHTLERRFAELGEQKLGIEQSVAELEQRTMATASGLEQRAVAAISGLQQRAVAITSDLEQHAVAVTSELERRLNEFTSGARIIGQEATDVTRLTSDLEAHVAQATADDRELARAGGIIASERLEERVRACESKQNTIEQGLAEVTRLTEALAAVETRIASLDNTRDLPLAEASVASLERRAAAAAADVARASQVRRELEADVARLQSELDRAAKAARHEVKRLIKYRQHIERQSTVPEFPQAGARNIPSVKAWRKVRVQLPKFVRREMLEPLLAIAVVVVSGVAATSVLTSPDQRRQAGRGTPVLLASRPLTGLEALPPVATIDREPLPSQASPRTPAAAPAGRPTRAATPALAAEAPAQAAATPEAPRDSRPPAASADAVRFVGTLSIDSDPSGATVFIDQQSVGQTPLSLTDLRAGSHVVRIERDGYTRWTTAVTVSSVKPSQISARLDRAQ